MCKWGKNNAMTMTKVKCVFSCRDDAMKQYVYTYISNHKSECDHDHNINLCDAEKGHKVKQINYATLQYVKVIIIIIMSNNVCKSESGLALNFYLNSINDCHKDGYSFLVFAFINT